MTSSAENDDSKLQVTDFKVGNGQIVEALLIVPRVGDTKISATEDAKHARRFSTHELTVEAIDDIGHMRLVEILACDVADKHSINLIDTRDKGCKWLGPSVQVATEKVGRWRLANDTTYYIRTTPEKDRSTSTISAELLSAVTGNSIVPEPGTRYAFSILLATHRCNASVKISAETADGSILQSWSGEANPSKKGGVNLEDYSAVTIDLIVPSQTKRLRIAVEKGPTIKGDDSYVFIAKPSLMSLAATAENRSLVTLGSNSLRSIAQSDQTIKRVVFRLSEPQLSQQSTQLTVRFTAQGHEATVQCTLPASLASVKVNSLKFEKGRLTFTGEVPYPDGTPIQIGVVVDGDLDTKVSLTVKSCSFGGSIQLPHVRLDDKQHAIELRTLPDQICVAFDYVLLPSKITPWSALQTHASAPLSINSSPAAQYHFRALRAWLDATRDGRVEHMPPLAFLHDELLAGFRQRQTYPPIDLTPATDPLVSIVIPVHNKFEVTYSCLCSLLFAYNRTAFEVIVVDDGSTDTTTIIDQFTTGLKLVRHEAAAGFVQSCNDGAALAQGQYIAFLNNDTEVTVGWLDELVRATIDFDNVGLVGSKLVYPDGMLQEAGGIVWSSGNPWNFGRRGNVQDPQFNYLRQVDYLSGAALLLERSLWMTVGGFSSEFAPGYFEDTDLAMKIRDAGYLVLYVPSSVVFHYEGQSAGTSLTSGMKQFQEVNRSKFKRKWKHIYSKHGSEGLRPDREKDRNVAFRVLFIDNHYPFVDKDAGSYAAFQEIRLIQSMGGKVTFLPHNLAWMDRHTLALQRMGVECLYAPFVLDLILYLEQNAEEYDLIYVNRFRIAEKVVDVVRSASSSAKIVLNLADLHFLRELRHAAIGSPGYSFDRAADTRSAELAVVKKCDLTLSYSDVELAVLRSHLDGPAFLARVPWVVDARRPTSRTFAATKDLLFLGGFGHPPNIAAVQFFAREVLPPLRERFPDIVFRVVGSKPPPEVLALTSEALSVEGYVPDLDESFATTRVFVAPLLAGAGIKGKVLEAMSRGCAMVLSPIGAEGIGLTNDQHCLIADNPEQWVKAIGRVYSDEGLWKQLGDSALQLAATKFSFAAGLEAMRDALGMVDIYGVRGLHYRHVRPSRYGDLP